MSTSITESVVEINRGSHIKPNWRELYRCAHFIDAEQWMFHNPQSKPTRARYLGTPTRTSYVPFGALDKSEF